ncbi:hypothetical protein HT031_005094 [Scenedesmus sp. PABB004]|nr:hypothetical protein HT031_005094 [Scenedesmus sp. PABB004]
MLRQQLKKTLNAADYAAINWVYAGATNLRYEQLREGTLVCGRRAGRAAPRAAWAPHLSRLPAAPRRAALRHAKDATLLNVPFTSLLPAGISCRPFYLVTGIIQGSVGVVQRSALRDEARARKLTTFLGAFKKEVLGMLLDPANTKRGLAGFYNTTPEVAASIYTSLWQPDGLLTAFCFNATRLSNTESIFAADTGIPIPKQRWWVKDWGCTHRDGTLN